MLYQVIGRHPCIQIYLYFKKVFWTNDDVFVTIRDTDGACPGSSCTSEAACSVDRFDFPCFYPVMFHMGLVIAIVVP